jgi:hypothetical protein
MLMDGRKRLMKEPQRLFRKQENRMDRAVSGEFKGLYISRYATDGRNAI